MATKAKSVGRGKDEMTLRQAKFAREYLIDLNGTQAAIRAGYSRKGADVRAAELLGNRRVSKFIEEQMAKSTAKSMLTIERVDQEIARLAFSDVRKLYAADGSLLRPDQWDDDTAAAVGGMDVSELWEGTGKDREQVGVLRKLKVWDKTAALTIAARRLGLLRDKVDVTGTLSLETAVLDSLKKTEGEK